MLTYANTVKVCVDFKLYKGVLREWIDGYQGTLLVIVEVYSDLESREVDEKQKLIQERIKMWATDFCPRVKTIPLRIKKQKCQVYLC